MFLRGKSPLPGNRDNLTDGFGGFSVFSCFQLILMGFEFFLP